MSKPRPHLKQLDELARDLVGDDGKSDVYFVSDSRGVFLVSTDFQAAYKAWLVLPTTEETALENRQIGVIASTEPEDDEPGSPLRTDDEVSDWQRRGKLPRTD